MLGIPDPHLRVQAVVNHDQFHLRLLACANESVKDLMRKRRRMLFAGKSDAEPAMSAQWERDPILVLSHLFQKPAFAHGVDQSEAHSFPKPRPGHNVSQPEDFTWRTECPQDGRRMHNGLDDVSAVRRWGFGWHLPPPKGSADCLQPLFRIAIPSLSTNFSKVTRFSAAGL